MKPQYSLIILLSALLSSCVSIYFEETQPKGAKIIHNFPEDLHGEWTAEGVKIVVDSDKMTTTEWKLDSLTQQMDTTIDYLYLSDTIFLTVDKPYFVYHYGNAAVGPWEIALIEKKKNGDILVYHTQDPENYKDDRNLKFKEARYINDETDTIVKTLKPEYEETMSFRSATYTGQMKKKTLRKIAVEENLIYTFTKDGRFIAHGNE